MRRSCPEHRAQWSELALVAESSGHLHGELGEIWLLGTIELDEHPIATFVRHAAEKIEPRSGTLRGRVQVQIAEISRPDHHTVAHLTVRRLQIGDGLTMITDGHPAAAVGAGSQVTGTHHRKILDLHLIGSRWQRLRPIAPADHEVGCQRDLPAKRLRFKMNDHMPGAWRQIEESPP